MLKRIICGGLVSTLSFYPFYADASSSKLPGTGSHFSLIINGAVVVLKTTTPNHYYPNAGIQVLTPGVRVSGNLRPNNDGSYLFSVSDLLPTTLTFAGNGTVSFKLCLNGVGKKYSCEIHAIDLSNPTPPPPPPPDDKIIFMTNFTYNGNLGGTAGADAICQESAYQSGSIIPSNLNFKALIVTSTRAPCSRAEDNSIGCGGAYAKDWPLTAGTVYYRPDNSTVFNTVNQNFVFDGSSNNLESPLGTVPDVDGMWMGIQSILTNSSANDIAGWALDDMNPDADSNSYNSYFASCNDFSSDSGNGTVAYNAGTPSAPFGVPANTWGNYYQFSDSNPLPYISNMFVRGISLPCNNFQSLICVSS